VCLKTKQQTKRKREGKRKGGFGLCFLCVFQQGTGEAQVCQGTPKGGQNTKGCTTPPLNADWANRQKNKKKRPTCKKKKTSKNFIVVRATPKPWGRKKPGKKKHGGVNGGQWGGGVVRGEHAHPTQNDILPQQMKTVGPQVLKGGWGGQKKKQSQLRHTPVTGGLVW